MSCLRLYLSGLALLLTVLAGGQNTSSQESRQAKLEKEIAQIDAQLKTNASKTSNAQSNLVLIRKKISNRNELIAESDREIQEINRQIGGKQREITIIQGRLDTLSLYYGNLVRNAYKNRDAKVWYMYLLSSENLGQAYRRMGYLRNLSGQMNVQAKKIEATREELKAETEKLENMRAEAQKLRESRQQEVRSLQSEEKDSQQLITQLTKDRRKYEQELNTKRKQVEALNKEIERIIREATKQLLPRPRAVLRARMPLPRLLKRKLIPGWIRSSPVTRASCLGRWMGRWSISSVSTTTRFTRMSNCRTTTVSVSQ